MNDIDSYFAKQCGVLIHNYANSKEPSWECRPTKDVAFGEWTIKDPRCRQIVREKFKITTWYSDSGVWNCSQSFYTCNEHIPNYEGKTIDEAEIACCEVIYEARDE